ncbi:MAG: TonB-dependent receptor [Ignavibacteria bacterium]
MIKKLLVLLLSAGYLLGQTGNVKGRIIGDDEALPGVNVFIIGSTLGGVSDDEGNYRIDDIPAGSRQIRFSAVGYETKFIDVNIEKDRTLELNVEMELKSIEIDVVEVVDKGIQDQNDTRVSLIDVKPIDVRELPGAVTDVFRSLQALPGVLAPNDFSSQLIIRGSGPDQNLIIMDDVEIFNPYRLYGVISMFNPEAVSDINLITGGFPANYGDRLSAVLDVTNREGPPDVDIKGNLNASIVSANLVLEGKNPGGVPGSWLINSRRTYYDLIIEPFVKNSGLVEDDVAFPNFYDIQGKFVFGPFNGHKFLINGVYSRDAVNLVSSSERENPDSIGVVDDSRNDLVSFAWHYTPNKELLNKFIVSWYRNAGDSDFDSEFLDPSLNGNDFKDIAPDTLSPYLVGFGFDADYEFRKYSIDDKLSYIWGKNNILEFGAGVDFMRTIINFDFEIDPELRAFLDANTNIKATFDDMQDIRDYSRYRIFFNNNFAIGSKLFLQPGLRYDYYNILEKGSLAPRVALSYAIDNLTTVRGVWGKYYQSPGYEKLRDRQAFLDFAPEYTTKIEAERATHYVFSIERLFTERWKVKFETYYKKFDDLIVQEVVTGTGYYTTQIPGGNPKLVSGWSLPIRVRQDSITQIPVNNSNGEAYGFEFFLEKRNIAGTDLNGWISYSLAYAERYEDGRDIPFRFDQRHTINIVMNYKINSWLDFGMRFQYGSGFPVTKAVGIKPRIILADLDGDNEAETPVIMTRSTISNPNSLEVVYDVDFGGLDNRFASRRPPYHRLDIRFSAAADYWDLDWTFYLDVINIYNRANVIGYDYYITEDLRLEKENQTMFPILPTLGFIVKF